MNLHLLLARADERAPVLETPLPLESVLGAPASTRLSGVTHLSDLAGDPNSLTAQRWALIVPEGERGRRLEATLAPLCALRAREQGAPVEVHRVSSSMDRDKAVQFREGVLHPSSRSRREHARYILLAGGLEELSQELQEVLVVEGACFVGRLAFEHDDDWEAYVGKVLAHVQAPSPPRKARALYLCAGDGSAAVSGGRLTIVTPAARQCQEERQRGHLRAKEILEEVLPKGSVDRLLGLASDQEPTLLFTLSHGIGAPSGGWRSVEAQWRRQGNLALGAGCELEPDMVRGRPFVPGGIWFYFACFGAGTPVHSVYAPWLKTLVNAGHKKPDVLEQVDDSRPVDGRPFIAALPQAALANEQGPLAVIAHLDLAWTHAFQDVLTGQSHVQRLEAVLSGLMVGHRAGPAFHALLQSTSRADARLLLRHKAEAVANAAGTPLPEELVEQAYLWMERQDIASYVLLGDPAVRLVVPH
ncbi:hypothetical protein OV208_04830 [Corallococcus sp. bb12-1]|uniref:hypothetical protein n=1 Tax=Corallococcus sp. bb12-1 TaxID=2996784 RepID=UPI00227021FB|nr:hypothetical protein [Corallococcus sp. bb12-1]MCY1040638.1 hypothetical protein [Corallococcus sp. bb12-1]